MKEIIFYLFGFFKCFVFCISLGKVDYFQPEQIHLSLAADDHSLVATWVTYASTETKIEFGINPISLQNRVKGMQSIFKYGNRRKTRRQYIHRAKMLQLKPNQIYFYRVGGNQGWSNVFWFKSFRFPNETNWSPRFAIYGDLGNENAQSLPRLQRETQSGLYDMILHIGDFAYDLDTDNGAVGDEFLRQIEPIAAYVPYMTCPGNHEQANNFSHYKNRFSMPERNGNFEEIGLDMYYSFNVGPVHFVTVNTEYYYFLQYGGHQIIRQYNWLKKDLELSSSEEQRKLRPWIIVLGHRPMYCSDQDGDDCTKYKARTRSGVPLLEIFGMEELLFEYNVDVAIWAHEHDWERLWPLYDWKIFNSSKPDNPYYQPEAPIHLITGSAGNREKHDPWLPQPNITAFRSLDYGYTRLTAHNGSHLQIEQISDDQNGKIIDQLWIVNHLHQFPRKQKINNIN